MPAFLTPILALLAVIATVLALVLLLRRRRGGERQRALGQLLDAADSLEARLRDARSEIEAIAGSDGNPVREAMQEMLRQRLWLQQHGGDASLGQLYSVRDSIEAARRRIDQQLVQIERARAPLP
jgi:methyl-accepting chemotaxis protein